MSHLKIVLQEVHLLIRGYSEAADQTDKGDTDIRVFHRNRDRFSNTERGIVYGTCPGLPETRGEVHLRHQRQQCGNWWSSDPSTRRQQPGCGLLQQNSVQSQDKLLCDSPRVAGNCAETGTFPQVSVRTRVSPTHRPLCFELAAEL